MFLVIPKKARDKMSTAIDLINKRIKNNSKNISSEQLTEIEKKEKFVRRLNIKYWQEIIPELDVMRERIGFVTKAAQDKADKFYLEIKDERKKLEELKKL